MDMMDGAIKLYTLTVANDYLGNNQAFAITFEKIRLKITNIRKIIKVRRFVI